MQIIPWGKLVKDPSAWINEECIPHGFEWKDPSKIQLGEVFRLMDHWRDREDQDLIPLIWVPTCPLLQDVEEPQRKVRNIRQAQPLQLEVSDEELFDIPSSSDDEEEFHLPDDDNGDDDLDADESSNQSSTEPDVCDDGMSDDSQSQGGGPGKRKHYIAMFKPHLNAQQRGTLDSSGSSAAAQYRDAGIDRTSTPGQNIHFISDMALIHI